MPADNRELINCFSKLQHLHEHGVDVSRRILRECNLGDDVELAHRIDIDRIGDSVAVSSIHRIAISVGSDFERSNEVCITLAILITHDSCSSSLRIHAEMDEALGYLDEGGNELLARRGEHSTVSEAIGRLDRNLKELPDFSVLLGPLVLPQP
ncbi:hypothetical protein ACGFX2_16050 [Streptomyces goshikiensis]|uniref:hypothetical protein n=1 Tax=Streptomyces goshikiensis TaxID=1942 RepID=UPI00371B880F